MIAIGTTPGFAASALTGAGQVSMASRAFADELASTLLLLRVDNVHVSQGMRGPSTGSHVVTINSQVQADAVFAGLMPWAQPRRGGRTRTFTRADRNRRAKGRNHREPKDD